jgi:hypothetical protein
LAELPTLPLEVQAAIELAGETLRGAAKVRWPMVFGRNPDDTGLLPTSLKYPRPANLKLQLQEYASALFDLEAQYYPRHSKDEPGLRVRLSILATSLSLDIAKELNEYSAALDFHCSFAERHTAIMDALSDRGDHWVQIAKNQYTLKIPGGKLEPLLASGAPRSKSERPIESPNETTRGIGSEISSREGRLQQFISTQKEKTTIADIRRAAQVFKANMQQWRREELSDDSAMSLRIENVLNGKTPVQPRGKSRGKNKG